MSLGRKCGDGFTLRAELRLKEIELTQRSRSSYYGHDVDDADLKRIINARLIQETGYLKDCLSSTNPLIDVQETYGGTLNKRPVLTTDKYNVTISWEYPSVFEEPKQALVWTNEADITALQVLAIKTKAEDKATALVDSLKMLIGGMLGYPVTETGREFSLYRGTTVSLSLDEKTTVTINTKL